MPQQIVHPVIVIPGITAAYLHDEYSFQPETVWGLLKKDYERITPHPDDTRYEALEPARVRAGQLHPAAYRELVAELRHNLSPHADRPTPVFTFAYDWRLPLARSVELLAEFIEEVIDRTRLLRHYDAAGWSGLPQVHLVAHSMGGLIAAGYLDRFGALRRVAKVASLATPFNGSFEAVLKIAIGTGDLGGEAPSSREREAARILPSLYHLIPAIPGSVQAEPELSSDLFQPQAWQRRVVQTLAEFIRLHGLRPDSGNEQANQFFASMLNQAQAYRRRVDELQLEAAGLSAADWLCVAGVNSPTRVRLPIRNCGGEPDFVLRSADRENRWQPDRCPAGRDWEQGLTGDGTVPFEGAVPRFLSRENVVCVTPQDFGYWEVADRLLDRAAGFHGILPNMNMLHRLIVRHFTNAPETHGATWGRPAPGVPPDCWRPSLPRLRNKDLKA
jgi:pimeloyl-ACP methyl ester carboxylesterase